MQQLVLSWATAGLQVQLHLRHSWATVGLKLGYGWTTAGQKLGHTWVKAGPQLGYSWATVGLQLHAPHCYCWATVEPQLAHSWLTVRPQGPQLATAGGQLYQWGKFLCQCGSSYLYHRIFCYVYPLITGCEDDESPRAA